MDPCNTDAVLCRLHFEGAFNILTESILVVVFLFFFFPGGKKDVRASGLGIPSFNEFYLLGTKGAEETRVQETLIK